ncbi:uncharacterized protein A4U43_C10F5340 [Asparagus officinalis]|uniref:Uncharacterized protein n=1 Tax=Asparagus officinalis TaxID=4686 RepID=A0A5P1E152_ASPOF|nr:uncharacterized protein A4U43_C10F5340 [Asparagus officinalis]
MYENKARLLCTAETSMAELFERIVTVADAQKISPRTSSRSLKKDDVDLCVDNELGFAKDRTISRLDPSSSTLNPLTPISSSSSSSSSLLSSFLRLILHHRVILSLRRSTRNRDGIWAPRVAKIDHRRSQKVNFLSAESEANHGESIVTEGFPEMRTPSDEQPFLRDESGAKSDGAGES